MKQYKVTLNFTFTPHHFDFFDGDEQHPEAEDGAKYMAFERTVKYYEKHDIVKHIKDNDAFGFVETLPCDGEVIDAKWDRKKFQIHMIVNTKLNEKDLEFDLRSVSLEDGEYEACGDTGWIVMTRGPNNEVFGKPWDLKGYWEYGLTDYRENPIEIKLIGDTFDLQSPDKLFTMTEEGKKAYQELAEASKKGITFTRSEKKIFWLMRLLMKDTKYYSDD